METRRFYERPEAELLVVRFEKNIMSIQDVTYNEGLNEVLNRDYREEDF